MSGANPPGTVRLPAEWEDVIRRHCAELYPLEACGALVGRFGAEGAAWEIRGAVPAPNEHDEDQRRRYRIPPGFQIRVEREARSAGLEVLGYYHSHPDHPARPSEYDRAHAWGGYVYIICSVEQGRPTELAAFSLEDSGAAFLPVEIARR